jgi:hypothetical protein
MCGAKLLFGEKISRCSWIFMKLRGQRESVLDFFLDKVALKELHIFVHIILFWADMKRSLLS